MMLILKSKGNRQSFSADFDFTKACGVELLDVEVEMKEFMESICLGHIWAVFAEILKGSCCIFQEYRLKSLTHSSLIKLLLRLDQWADAFVLRTQLHSLLRIDHFSHEVSLKHDEGGLLCKQFLLLFEQKDQPITIGELLMHCIQAGKEVFAQEIGEVLACFCFGCQFLKNRGVELSLTHDDLMIWTHFLFHGVLLLGLGEALWHVGNINTSLSESKPTLIALQLVRFPHWLFQLKL